MPMGDMPRREGAVLNALAQAAGRRRTFSPLVIPDLPGPGLFRFVVTDDPGPPVAIDPSDGDLDDDMTRSVFGQGEFPSTLTALLGLLERPDVGLDGPATFLVADGAQLPTDLDVVRHFRWAIAWTRQGQMDLMISSGAVSPVSGAPDERNTFLQVMAWDRAGHFNFYQRVSEDGWVLAGNSWDALEPVSRGRGPFDSHVNGAPVMKELREPWSNWHSMDADVLTHLAPDDPLRSDPLMANLLGAEDLERLVGGGIRRWTNARLDRTLSAPKPVDTGGLLRHLVTGTTVNLIASRDRAAPAPTTDTVRVPLSIFFDVELLLNRGLLLGPADAVPDVLAANPAISASHYVDAVDATDMALIGQARDGSSVRVPGDGFFALIAPEPAAEDTALVAALIDRAILTERFAGCVAMVDFPNPVFSAERADLMTALPDSFDLLAGAGPISELLASAIRNDADGSEAFGQWWDLGPDAYRTVMVERLATYMSSVSARLSEPDGVLDLIRLVASRRRRFRSLALSEFSLTVPVTASDERLMMTETGEVVADPTPANPMQARPDTTPITPGR